MAQRIDGIIEAARYKNGQIAMTRVYERRGEAFSDRVLLDRKALVERLQKGKKFHIGTRDEFMGGTFKTGKPVYYIKRDDREIISTDENAAQDGLEGAPLF